MKKILFFTLLNLSLVSCSTENTNVSTSDTDQDGLSDVLEAKLGTDSNIPDTDGDKLLDGTEDYNKNGKQDSSETDALNKDTDDDGLKDGTEDANHNGIKENLETNPLDSDSDDDGTNDGDEDSDGDGDSDSEEDDDDRN